MGTPSQRAGRCPGLGRCTRRGATLMPFGWRQPGALAGLAQRADVIPPRDERSARWDDCPSPRPTCPRPEAINPSFSTCGAASPSRRWPPSVVRCEPPAAAPAVWRWRSHWRRCWWCRWIASAHPARQSTVNQYSGLGGAQRRPRRHLHPRHGGDPHGAAVGHSSTAMEDHLLCRAGCRPLLVSECATLPWATCRCRWVRHRDADQPGTAVSASPGARLVCTRLADLPVQHHQRFPVTDRPDGEVHES